MIRRFVAGVEGRPKGSETTHRAIVYARIAGRGPVGVDADPQSRRPTRTVVMGLIQGTKGSIRDKGEPEPHTPRGCIVQAWGVAEVLRTCPPSRSPLGATPSLARPPELPLEA